MKLKTYLIDNNLTVAAFAEMAVISCISVYKYMSGERIPKANAMHRIVIVTRGDVTANDFYDIQQDMKSKRKVKKIKR